MYISKKTWENKKDLTFFAGRWGTTTLYWSTRRNRRLPGFSFVNLDPILNRVNTRYGATYILTIGNTNQAEICSAFICWLFRNQVSSMWVVEGPDWQIFVQGPNWQIFVQGRNRGDLGLNSATTRMGGRWWEETSFVRIWVKYQSRESVQSKYSKIAQFVEFIDPFYPKYYLKYEIWAIDKQIVRLFL